MKLVAYGALLLCGLTFLCLIFFIGRANLRRPYLLPHEVAVKIDEIIHEVREHPDRELPCEKLRALDLAHLGAGATVAANRKFAVLLYDTDPRVRERVLPWLKGQTNHVFLMLSDPNERVRAAAVTHYYDYYGLSGDWLQKACNDPSKLVRTAALKRKCEQATRKQASPQNGPLRAILKCSPSLFRPKEKVTLTLEINNTSAEVQTLPAGAQVIFSTMPTAVYEIVVPYAHTISLNSSIHVPPGGQHVFRFPVSSLIGWEGKALGTEPGIWTITAVCLPSKPKDFSARPGWNIHALREHALCSASIKVECAKDFGVAFDKAFEQMSQVDWQHPPRYEELLHFFDLGKSKRQVDGLFKRTGRLIEPHNTTTAWRYWIHWDYYILVPYRGVSDEDLAVSGTPQLRRGQRPAVPVDIPISDWVNAEGGLLLKIEPTRDEFQVGQPVDIRVTLRNVDRCPLELYRPFSPFGENELFRMKLCSERDRWTENAEPPSPRSAAERKAQFVRRNRPGPGYSYSFLTSTGSEFVFVNERAKVSISKICGSKSNKDTQKIKLAPGQSYSFITSIGGLDAHRPVGHSLRPGLYRVAFSYTRWLSWTFSNTSTIKITKESG